MKQIRAEKRLQRKMWIEKCSRLRSGYVGCRCCCGVRVLCFTAIMRRLSIDDMCLGHAVRCVRGAVTHTRVQSMITFFSDRCVCTKT